MKLSALVLIFCIAAGYCPGIYAQGGITTGMMNEIRKGYEGTSADKALRNALGGTDINTIAFNQENRAAFDTHFTYKVPSNGITDQKSSGRCWLFTGLNILRAQVMEFQGISKLEFSQNYCFFYDQLEKANLFLQGIIDTKDRPMDDKVVEWLFLHPISDGGQFTGISDIIGKYGVVPKGVMPETSSSESTRTMSYLISLKLREQGLALRNMKNASAEELQKQKTAMLAVIYRMLALTLGEPVQQFTWKKTDAQDNVLEVKEYTPLSFYNEYVGNDLANGYVMFMNDPSREYYKLYSIDYDRHTYDGRNWTYINLPVDEIKKMAIESLKNHVMMYFSCDVAKFLDKKNGTLDINNYDYESLMGTAFGMNKEQRIISFASGSSHAMTLMAVDLDNNNKPVKWMVENSWGASSGYKGHLIMTDKWFDEYMFRLVVEKRFVPEKILKILKDDPVLLPAWDPMFAEEE